MYACRWMLLPSFLLFSLAGGPKAVRVQAAMADKDTLRIGWAATDITPDKPVMLQGQFHARVSEGVKDPVTATVLALQSPQDETQMVLVSCDLVIVHDALRDAVRDQLRQKLPELDPMAVLMSATHTHTAPHTSVYSQYQPDRSPIEHPYGMKLDAMTPAEYVNWASPRIADAIVHAWQERTPGGIGYGLSHAVVGHNRLITYSSGRSQMYGNTNHPDFSHVEGYEDHALNILATYDLEGRLTGLVINIACPSQDTEGLHEVSADFWHDTRQELRRRLGDDLFVLPQTAAAGDQSPHVMVDKRAEARMERITGRTRRQQIATRIADGTMAILPFIKKEINYTPRLRHQVETLELPRRIVPEADSVQAAADADRYRKAYEDMLHELQVNPKQPEQRHWYHKITSTHSFWRRHERVANRFQLQQTYPNIPIEVHVARLGDVACVSVPFEYYLDFGLRIQARSKAVQTFVIQLAGSGSYLPTLRSVAGGGYGAVPASTEVGPESGQQLVEWAVDHIDKLWKQ